MSADRTMPRRAVYRALVGGYEQLREEEVAHDSGLPFICFTDDPTLTSETWQVVVVEARLPRDPTRSARALKILGHPALEDFDETLWVDNTVALTRPPDELFDEWLADADVAAPLHSYRASVLAEAEAVLDSGLDDFARVYEQLTHYLSVDAEALEANPHWTGMLARRRTDSSVAAMTGWWEDVLRYSRRDQLSFVPAMRRHRARLASLPVDSHVSPWHEWPRAEGRDRSRTGSGLREALRPPVARIGVLQQALDEATRTLAVTVDHRDEIIARHDETITGLHEALAEANQRAHDHQVELDTVRHERNLTARDLNDAKRKVRRLRRRLQRATGAPDDGADDGER
ncbi:glycosyltransferase domain-containing protein [Nocardioides glacieisoli]|nr:glycosyltransferase domain-containing protein [Nocardioides glacieisoli]